MSAQHIQCRIGSRFWIVGYSVTDVTATALRVEFVRRSVSERDGRERRGESEFGEEFSFTRKFAGVRDGNTTGAEHGMLHSKPVDAQEKDGRSPAPTRLPRSHSICQDLPRRGGA